MRAAFFGAALAILFSASVASADSDAGVDAGADDATAIVARAEHANGAEKKACEAQLVAMGEAAVPALIVGSKKFASEEGRKWCEDTLAEMGKRSAADDVQTSTDEALIAVFGAFGQTRDIDALSAIFPFIGADRIAIRKAAREALAAYGDTIHSRLRAEYINIGGQIPSGTEPATAQLLDGYVQLREQLRLQDVTALFGKGLVEAKTDLPTAIADFDSALAREPLLENRKEAAPYYVQFARDRSSADRKLAREYDLKAIRVAGEHTPDGDRAASMLAFFDADNLRTNGIIDRASYDKALALDPQNQEAKDALAALDADVTARENKLRRFEAAIAAAVAVTALFTAALIAFLRRHRS
jgi:hypothetical protein